MKKVTPEKPGEVIPGESKPFYPGFTLKIKDIEEARHWKVGQTYMMLIGVKMTSIHEDERESSVSFDVLKVKPIVKK